MSTSFQSIKNADVAWHQDYPYSIAFDEPYFLRGNALDEARDIFINGNQLVNRWQALSAECAPHFVIAETGFGCGLNFLLAWSLWEKYAPSSAILHFISCEQYPLSPEDLSRCLNTWPQLQEQAQRLLTSYPILTPGFHFLQFENGRVNLTLMLGDVLACYRELPICGDALIEKKLRDYYMDAWFLDGFSPAKNPAMWSDELFTIMGVLSSTHTTVATPHTDEGVQQGLSAVGFDVNHVSKPGSEENMLVGEFARVSAGHTPRHTPWHVSIPKTRSAQNAIVLGAGLAGCYTAHALARRGWSVTLLDTQPFVASGASGNNQAILFPQLTTFCSPLTNFMLSAYLFAVRSYQQILKQFPLIGELSGMLQLAYNQKECVNQAKLQSWLAHYPELGALVNADQASTFAGVPLESGGVFVPNSGWLDSPALCQFLIQMKNIEWMPNTHASSISYDKNEWHVGEYHAEVLVIANGYSANRFNQTNHLPLKTIRGQMTSFLSNEHSESLHIPLCAGGHILPAREGIHALGATYHSGSVDHASYPIDNVCNLEKLNTLSPAVAWSDEVTGQWTGIRAATPDYLPLVGPVADAELFRQRFAGLVSNSRRWIPMPGVFHQDLYVCTGFGSRGLTTIPLSAEWLAATINGEHGGLPRTMTQSFSPARFLRREIIRP